MVKSSIHEAAPRDKDLGRYYTPNDVAGVLVEWAINKRPGRLLDPSFGGCSFLVSGLYQLEELVGHEAVGLVFGVDIDPSADSHTQELLRGHVPRSNLVIGDFLQLHPSALGGRFRCVVGNPPFLSHRALNSELKQELVSEARKSGCQLPATANVWAHFVVLSTRYLERGGRLAFLVSSSGLQSDYAQPLLTYLAQLASRVTLVPINESMFAGTPERVTALLVEGWGEGPGDVLSLGSVGRQQLRDLVTTRRGLVDLASSRNEAAAWSLVEEVANRLGWRDLSHYADIRIGTVTGANKFFVRRPSEVSQLKLVSRTTLTSGREMRGIRWTPADARRLIERDGRCQLLDLSGHASESCPDPTIRAVLSEGIEAGVPDRTHSLRRARWWVVEDTVPGDAVFHYMTDGTPRVVLNEAKSLSTNSVHRLFWKRDEFAPEAIASSTCTSLFQLACELRGRSLSGGLLKLEPSDAKLLKVAGESRSLSKHLDRLLKAGNRAAARDLADQVMLLDNGVDASTLDEIRKLVEQQQSIRRRGRSR